MQQHVDVVALQERLRHFSPVSDPWLPAARPGDVFADLVQDPPQCSLVDLLQRPGLGRPARVEFGDLARGIAELERASGGARLTTIRCYGRAGNRLKAYSSALFGSRANLWVGWVSWIR